MNKKGNAGAVILISLLTIFVLALGFVFVLTSSTVNFVSDTIVPEISNIGQVGDTNFTDISRITLTPIDNTLNTFNWLIGVGMVISLGLIIGLAYAFRGTANGMSITLFFVLALLMIVVSIILSNAYENFYFGNDFLGERLQDQPISSYLLLYSPMIYILVSFIGAIILFSGRGEEGII